MKSKKPEKGFDLAVLAAQLEKAKRGAGFDSFTFRQIAAVLSTALQFKPEVPKRERQRLTWEACVSAKAGGTITVKSLLGAFHRGQEEFLKSLTRDFVFVTTISLPISRVLYRRAIHAGSAVITDSLPPRYLAARASEMNQIPESDQRPPDHKYIRMSVSARSAHEAVDLALDKIDLIRASWNFLLNERTISQISYPTREEPINQILLGRCHSLHQRNGEIALNGHFRRTRESLPSRTKAISQSEWVRARKRHRSTVLRLRHHPYPEILRNGLVRYVRSLDFIDEESCFLKLWSLVEYLTGTGHGSYDMTIQRIQFLLQEYG